MHPTRTSSFLLLGTLAVVASAGGFAAQPARTASALALAPPQSSAASPSPKADERRRPPSFTDPARLDKLRSAFPEVRQAFERFAAERHVPGYAYGILVEGDLVASGASGFADLSTSLPVGTDTVFRIASMTKSFTALAILALRDAGRLSLDDEVARWVPELRELRYPTGDSPALTIRQLLTHSEGFPEDNPWGDRQLGVGDDTMSAWMRAGIPFSNAPGVAYEYSNFGFAILGRIVTQASGMPYRQFVDERILRPLDMDATYWDARDVPAGRLAMGYRWQDGAWHREEPLADGAFGAMGGLFTSTRDLARYVSFLMSAWPPRDDPDDGPVRRASLREMQQVWRVSAASATRDRVDGPLRLSAPGYGYGLRVVQDCRTVHVSHGGGLPGYGSSMRWLPDYAVGIVVLGNVTYAGWSPAVDAAVDALARSGGLVPRAVRPSPALHEAQQAVNRLMEGWEPTVAHDIAADNLFLDRPEDARARELMELRQRHGACRPAGALAAENALRGSWRLACDRGTIDVSITLAPTTPPKVQWWTMRSALPPQPRLATLWSTVLQLATVWDAAGATAVAAAGARPEDWRRQLGAVAATWGACRPAEPYAGDGVRTSVMRFSCERGPLLGSMSVTPDGRIETLSFSPPPEVACVP